MLRSCSVSAAILFGLIGLFTQAYGLVVGCAVVLLLSLIFAGGASSAPASCTTAPPAQNIVSSPPAARSVAITTPPVSVLTPARDLEREGALKHQLLVMAHGDQALVNRLIQYEAKQNPGAPHVEHVHAAIVRWHSDRNRW